MDVPQKIKNRVTMWPSNPSSGYLPEKFEKLFMKIYVPPIFIAALFMVAKTWKQLMCTSIDDWIKKILYIFRYRYLDIDIEDFIYRYICI